MSAHIAEGAGAGRRPRSYMVFGFETTHDALAAEAVLVAAGVDVTPIPAPKALGALCGLAMRFSPQLTGRAEEALAEAGVVITGALEMKDL